MKDEGTARVASRKLSMQKVFYVVVVVVASISVKLLLLLLRLSASSVVLLLEAVIRGVARVIGESVCIRRLSDQTMTSTMTLNVC